MTVVTGSRAAGKSKSREEDESGSDYEEVVEQEPVWKAQSLPAKLQPGMNILSSLCIAIVYSMLIPEQGSHAPLKVLDSFSPKFKALKVLETGQVLESP